MSSVMLVAGIAIACGDEGTGGSPQASGTAKDATVSCKVDKSYHPTIDSASFVEAVDNPYFPLKPGTKLSYDTGTEATEITVLPDKKEILGVSCTVVHDEVRIGGKVAEDTYDWFAQDSDGAVWYFGEDTKEYSGTKVSTEGSWTGGVDGAKPGYIIPPAPSVGMKFRQEYLACEAEDMAEVVDMDASADVPAGSYTGCMKMKETTALEPTALEEKYYCKGVGVVLSVDLRTKDRDELTAMQ
jgi:hypothetical protein